MSRHLVCRVSLLLQKSHYNLALIFILFHFCSSCLLLLVLILILYRHYLLWHQNKIEFTHVGDQSLLPRMPAWSLALMMSVTRSTARATPKKVASGEVTASQYDEEHTLTGTPSGLASHEEGASGSLGVS